MDENTNVQEKEIFIRLSQVFEITLNLPLEDKGINLFYNQLNKRIDLSNQDDSLFNDILSTDDSKCILAIHTNDVANVLIDCFQWCQDIGVDIKILGSFFRILKTFKNLRVVNFNFIFGQKCKELMEDFNIINDIDFEGDRNKSFSNIYNIDVMEVHLSDVFTKDVVDFLNKMFIFHEFIPNSYMKRVFYVDFEFNDYINFIDMILSNNKEFVKSVDQLVIDCLISFPTIVVDHKPMIRLVTNYYDL